MARPSVRGVAAYGRLLGVSTRVALEHTTGYAFATPVRLGPHLVRLRPAPQARARVESHGLVVTTDTGEHEPHWHQDPFGGWQARVTFADPVTRLDLAVRVVADLVPVNPFDFVLEPDAASYPFTYDHETWTDLAPYLRPVEGAADVRRLRGGLPAGGVATVALLGDLNAAVHRAVAYTTRLEAGFQRPDETLALGSGSCRDSAWLLVALLRQHGLAARFVSGYLVQLADPAVPDAVAADDLELHAWAEAWLPGAGWIGLDPTGGLFTAEGHLPLSAAPHPDGAAPVTGTTSDAGPGGARLTYAHGVRRLDGP